MEAEATEDDRVPISVLDTFDPATVAVVDLVGLCVFDVVTWRAPAEASDTCRRMSELSRLLATVEFVEVCCDTEVDTGSLALCRAEYYKLWYDRLTRTIGRRLMQLTVQLRLFTWTRTVFMKLKLYKIEVLHFSRVSLCTLFNLTGIKIRRDF